jgi:hypothetical protein
MVRTETYIVLAYIDSQQHNWDGSECVGVSGAVRRRRQDHAAALERHDSQRDRYDLRATLPYFFSVRSTVESMLMQLPNH